MSKKARPIPTPGPWIRGEYPAKLNPTIRARGNIPVCKVLLDPNVTDGEMEANSNLIQAAPELLAALREALGVILDGGGQAAQESAVASGFLAIKKAEGR